MARRCACALLPQRTPPPHPPPPRDAEGTVALPLVIDIAIGQLRRRKRQSIVSIMGVALGVGFFIAVASLMQGFQQYFVSQVIDIAPHIVIKDEFRTPAVQPAVAAFAEGAVAVRGVKPRDEIRGIRDARGKLAALEAVPGLAAAPTLRGPVILRYGARDHSVALVGVEPERERRVTNIEKDMIAGRLEDLRATANGVILGIGAADRLGAGVGDIITAVSPRGVAVTMKVVGLFSTGLTALDQGEGYALLKTVQILQQRPNVVNSIRIRLADITQAEPLARVIEARFGYRTESWEETNSNILSLFIIQNAIMYSVTGAILLVAAFGIYNIISTVVHEKTRDIAILKSLGFTEGDIARIFSVQGFVVGAIGAALGCLLGWALIEMLAAIRFDFNNPVLRGQRGFIMSRSALPFIFAGGFALVSASAASILPARRAARLNPVDIVRGAA
ncbi:MAG: ABC transporter permease [Alphaproteobacteria bacterium]|nr:ABC transporter permease [Alphaproteobacteria bacterium]